MKIRLLVMNSSTTKEPAILFGRPDKSPLPAKLQIEVSDGYGRHVGWKDIEIIFESVWDEKSII